MKYLRLWIQVVLLTATLTLSPVFAEALPQPKIDTKEQENETAYVGHGILDVLPRSGAAAKKAFPDPPGGGVQVSSPGRTYGTLVAILAAAGGAAALAYFFTRPPKPVPPVPTTVTTGTPIISAPPGH